MRRRRLTALFIGPKAEFDALVTSAYSPGDPPGDTQSPPSAQATNRKCTRWKNGGGRFFIVAWNYGTRVCCDIVEEDLCDENGKNCETVKLAKNCKTEHRHFYGIVMG